MCTLWIKYCYSYVSTDSWSFWLTELPGKCCFGLQSDCTLVQVYSKLCTGIFSSASIAFSFFNVSIEFEIIKNQFKNISKYIYAHDVLDLYVWKTIKLMSDKFTILVNLKSVEGYILLRGKLVEVNCLENRGNSRSTVLNTCS